jgi:hypothetical protein
MKPTTLRLDRLETRLAPAIATWDGGGADNNWTTAANWVGDVAPQPGDDLVFPLGPPRTANVNDFPAGTAFHSMAIGPNYHMTGNAIALVAGLTCSGFAPRILFSLTLTGDQTFSGGVHITGSIDVNGHALTLTGGTAFFAGPITGTGSLTIAGSTVLPAVNTFTGPTTVAGTLNVSGTLPGPVTVQPPPPSGRSALFGSGTVGDVTVHDRLIPAEGEFAQQSGTLKTGNLSLASTAQAEFTFFRDIGTGTISTSSLAVTGTVQVGGRLFLAINHFSSPQPRPNDKFTLISNDGTDPIVGTFANIPEGGDVRLGNLVLRITYRGGDGNDLVVTVSDRGPRSYAVGAGAGGVPLVNVYDANSRLIRSFFAYASNFRGGVRVAMADATGDGVPDVITAPGPGGGPHIRVFDGVTFAVVKEFMAYDPLFTGGVFVAAARMNAQDANAEIITGAGAGGGPHVKVFDGATGATGPSFFAYDGAFRGGVSVAGADYYTNFRGDTASGHIVTGPGRGGGGDIRVFDGTTGAVTIGFFIYDAAFRGGVNVAAIGPLYAGDDITDGAIVTTPASGGTVVNVFYRSGSPNLGFQAYDASFLGGVTVAVQAFSAEGTVTVLTGTGPGGSPQIKGWQVAIPTGKTTLAGSIFAFDPAFLGGIFVG